MRGRKCCAVGEVEILQVASILRMTVRMRPDPLTIGQARLLATRDRGPDKFHIFQKAGIDAA